MNTIDIFKEGSARLADCRLTKKIIVDTVDAVLQKHHENNVHVSVILCDDEVITHINSSYRNRDYATDVISFAYRDNPFPGTAECGTEELGDIYISLPKALAQAPEYGNDPRTEVRRLLVHGTLHLLGFDHERSEKDRVLMEDLEDGIMHELCD
jgi:probable rRNA maturation factor